MKANSGKAPSVKVPCPACGQLRALKGMARHTNACSKWGEVIGTPPSEFNFDRHFKRGLFEEELREGVDYVTCRICQEKGVEVRKKRLMDHLKKIHRLDQGGYQERYPGSPVRLTSTSSKRRASVRQRFGVDNVFQAEDVKEKAKQTSQERYGVDHASQTKEAKRRRAETNKARYGAENVFGSAQVQQKIRDTHLETRGVENPNQDPEVMAKRIATNRERYGADHFLQTEEFQERVRETSQERYGTDHHMQSEEGFRVYTEAFEKRHGVPTPWHSDKIQAQAYATNLFNHGGRHSQQCPEVRAKARKTWLEKYGVDNPSKADEVKERIKEVWKGKYGVPFPPQSMWSNREVSFPNKLEQDVDEMSPACMVYAGDGSYWVRCKGSSRVRNPDFVVLTRNQLRAYQDGSPLNDLRTSAVCEVFGVYWHSKKFTGKTRAAHKSDVIAFYAAVGIECLVLWEDEIRRSPKKVANRLKRWITKWRDRFEEPPQGLAELFV